MQITGMNSAGDMIPVKVTDTGEFVIHIEGSSVPTGGDATAANQVETNANLADIITKLSNDPATLAAQNQQLIALDETNTHLVDITSKLPTPINGLGQVISLDYGIAVARGLIAGVTTKSINGYNAATSTSVEPIWAESGVTYPFPTVATTFTVSSSSALDTAVGTGARTVSIPYIDATTFNEVVAVVTLNGQTPVTFTVNGWRINPSPRVLTAGTNNTNVGIIYIGYGTVTLGKPVNVLSSIVVGANEAQQAIYTVPANKMFEGLAYRPTLVNSATFKLRYRLDGYTVFWTAFDMPLNTSTPFTSPFASVFPPKTDIMVMSSAEGGTTKTGMIISGFLRSI